MVASGRVAGATLANLTIGTRDSVKRAMWNRVFGRQHALELHRRWGRAAGDRLTLREVGLLLLLGGAAAALANLIELNLRLPGHAILRATLPLAAGMALVPRYGAGTVMGLASLGTSLIFRTAGLGDTGWGAMASTSILGPLLDLFLSRAGSGRQIYMATVLAAVAANLAAFGIQAALKLGGHGRSLSQWLPLAAVTYPAFGIVAGLISGAMCFRWERPRGRGCSPPAKDR